MEESTKKRLSIAAPIAAGVGTYLISRHPSAKGIIRQVRKKYMEPVMIKHPEHAKGEPLKRGAKLKERIEHHLGVLAGKTGIRGHIKGPVPKTEAEMPEAAKAVSKKNLLLGLEAADITKIPRVKGQVRATIQADPHAQLMLDKFRYGKKLAKHGLGPQTNKVLDEQADIIKSVRVGALPKVLQMMFGKHMVLKPRSDTLYHLGTSTGSESIWRTGGIKKGYETPMGGNVVDKEKLLKNIKAHPKDYIVQEALHMPDPAREEIRVTAINDKVVHTRPRVAFPNVGSTRILHWSERKKLEDLVKKHHKLFHPKNKITPVSFDVSMRDTQGRFNPQIIEANVGISGGELDMPTTARRFYKTLTGRAPVYEAAAKGLGAAGMTHVGMRPLLKHQRDYGKE